MPTALVPPGANSTLARSPGASSARRCARRMAVVLVKRRVQKGSSSSWRLSAATTRGCPKPTWCTLLPWKSSVRRPSRFSNAAPAAAFSTSRHGVDSDWCTKTSASASSQRRVSADTCASSHAARCGDKLDSPSDSRPGLAASPGIFLSAFFMARGCHSRRASRNGPSTRSASAGGWRARAKRRAPPSHAFDTFCARASNARGNKGLSTSFVLLARLQRRL